MKRIFVFALLLVFLAIPNAIHATDTYIVELTPSEPTTEDVFRVSDEGYFGLSIVDTWAAVATTGGIEIQRRYTSQNDWQKVELFTGNTEQIGHHAGGNEYMYRAIGVNMTAGTAKVIMRQH